MDKSKLAGPIIYTPVDTRDGYWTWTSTGFAIGSRKDAGAFHGRRLTGTLDTATPVMILPESVAREYYSHVEGARYDEDRGGWVFACDAQLPDFTFGVGGDAAGGAGSSSSSSSITVPGSYLNTGPADMEAAAGTGAAAYAGGREKICAGGIQTLGEYVVFGAVALKAGVVVFDASKGGERLGWANKTLDV